MSRDYVAIAQEYARDVVAGVIPACKWTRLACQRQLDDLAREGWGYRFDADRATHVCRFIEKLQHVKGRWARERQRLTLEPNQIFRLTTVFGWVDSEGCRRFKTVYVEVPRKNAKSTESAGVALYCLVADDEPGAEVYSGATTRDQAKVVWDVARRMVDRDAGMRGRFGVATGAHTVYVDETGSFFRPLSRDQQGNHDGLNVHCAIIDELHAHKTRELYDVLETATGSREQPLLWQITTAGFNRAGICYEQRAYVLRILEGIVDDPEYFGIIYTIDEDDDWTDPDVWRKANPNWDVSVDPGDIARKARKAMEMAAARNNFLTKHLNLWVNADTAWMDMIAWDRCGDSTLSEEEFLSEQCYAALDLASKVDIAAKLKLFVREIDGAAHYYAFGKYYLPEVAAEDGRNSQYSGWADEQRLVLTPGNVIDYEFIKQDLRDDASRFELVEVPYDPFQATQLSTELLAEGFPMLEMRPTVLNFSEPMKELERLVLSGRFHHDGCPVLAWMINNVVCHMDAKDNIYPRKEFPENKIDGAVALIMALGRAMLTHETGNIEQGFVVLS